MVFYPPSKVCPRCKTEVGNLFLQANVGSLMADRYCFNCGLQLLGKCSRCEARLVVFQRFCQECGVENALFHGEAEAGPDKSPG